MGQLVTGSDPYSMWPIQKWWPISISASEFWSCIKWPAVTPQPLIWVYFALKQSYTIKEEKYKTMAKSGLVHATRQHEIYKFIRITYRPTPQVHRKAVSVVSHSQSKLYSLNELLLQPNSFRRLSRLRMNDPWMSAMRRLSTRSWWTFNSAMWLSRACDIAKICLQPTKTAETSFSCGAGGWND